MSYSAEISRRQPTSIIILIDQSRSMSENFGEHEHSTKAEFVSDVVNRTLHELIIRCTKTAEVRNYYYISILAYGSSTGPALGGPFAGCTHVPISDLAGSPMRIESRIRKVPGDDRCLTDQVVRFPVWIDPKAGGWTHMCAGFSLVRQLVQDWVSKRREGFPPTVLHLTDGGSTDGDPTTTAMQILSQCTSDGNALIFNCHVSNRSTAKFEYPSNDAGFGDRRARTLFQISSVLPEPFLHSASRIGLALAPGARGFVFNGDPVSVVQFFQMGTQPANLR